MHKKLSKVIINKSRLRNKYLKWPSRKNILAYKKVKNICNALTRYFEYIAKNKNLPKSKTSGIQSDIIITNKSTISDENIKIKAEENQNIKINNKNKNKLVSIKIRRNHIVTSSIQRITTNSTNPSDVSDVFRQFIFKF